MKAIREIVNKDIFTGYEVPKEFGDEFEMILIPTKEQNIDYSGNKSEDVKGDTLENEQFLAATYNDAIEDNPREDEIWSKYL